MIHVRVNLRMTTGKVIERNRMGEKNNRKFVYKSKVVKNFSDVKRNIIHSKLSLRKNRFYQCTYMQPF